jgi:hypothetical protein
VEQFSCASVTSLYFPHYDDNEGKTFCQVFSLAKMATIFGIKFDSHFCFILLLWFHLTEVCLDDYCRMNLKDVEESSRGPL